MRDELKTKDQIRKARVEKEKRKLKQGGIKRKRESDTDAMTPRPSKRFKNQAHGRSKAIVKRK